VTRVGRHLVDHHEVPGVAARLPGGVMERGHDAAQSLHRGRDRDQAVGDPAGALDRIAPSQGVPSALGPMTLPSWRNMFTEAAAQ
jgi:hypothetical protein